MKQVNSPPRIETEYASGFIHLETYHDDLIVTKAPGEPLYIGKVYEMSPLTGGGGEFGSVVVNMFKSVPDETIIQHSEIIPPDFSAPNKYLHRKNTSNSVIKELLYRQASVLEKALTVGWQEDMPILNKKTIILTVSIPVGDLSRKTLDEAEQHQTAFLTSIRSCGFHDARVLSIGETLGVYRMFGQIFTPRQNVEMDPMLEVRYQAYGPGDKFDFRLPHVGILSNDVFCAGVTPKAYPKQVTHDMMNLLIGAPMNKGTVAEGGGHRINTPFIINTTIRVAQQRKESERVKRAIESRSGTGKALPFKLGDEDTKETLKDLHNLQKACSNENDKYVYTSTHIFVFAKSREEALHARAQLKTSLDLMKYDAREIVDDLLPRFVQCLPLNYSNNIAKKLACETIMPASSAACLLPIYGDQHGNADPINGVSGSPFITRRGESYYFNPFRSNGNYNGMLHAKSGAGKTVALQYFILNLLADNVKVLFFDNGRSVEKFCRSVDGDFIDFRINAYNKPSLNPFTGLDDAAFDQEMENITALLLLMAYEDDNMDPMASIAMREAVKSAYASTPGYTEIEHVIQSLENTKRNTADAQREEQIIIAVTNLIPRLRAFIESPTRGAFFRGPSTLNPNSQFTVFEMKGLEGDPHLHKVVMFFTMNTSLSQMAKLTGIPKICFIDEAADHLKDKRAAEALDGLYRKGRKDQFSTWIITQSPRDLPGTEGGEVILSQSNYKIVMQQEIEEIEKAISEKVIGGRFKDDPYFQRLIRDVTTRKGVFSELLIMNDDSYEVVRLYLDRFVAAMFSSEGEERVKVFELMDQGMDPISALDQIMGNTKRRRSRWIEDFIDNIRGTEKISPEQLLEEITEKILSIKQ